MTRGRGEFMIIIEMTHTNKCDHNMCFILCSISRSADQKADKIYEIESWQRGIERTEEKQTVTTPVIDTEVCFPRRQIESHRLHFQYPGYLSLHQPHFLVSKWKT